MRLSILGDQFLKGRRASPSSTNCVLQPMNILYMCQPPVMFHHDKLSQCIRELETFVKPCANSIRGNWKWRTLCYQYDDLHGKTFFLQRNLQRQTPLFDNCYDMSFCMSTQRRLHVATVGLSRWFSARQQYFQVPEILQSCAKLSRCSYYIDIG